MPQDMTIETGIDAPMSEAQIRKARSIDRLRSENVPFIEHLPVSMDQAESLRRTPSEVVERAIALFISAEVAIQDAYEFAPDIIRRFEASEFFSPGERTLFDLSEVSEQARINAAWRMECVHVLLWAAGFIPSMGSLDVICDVPEIESVFARFGTADLKAKVLLRSQEDILDEADLMYRYHWAVRNAWLNGQEAPNDLMSGVVSERHHALNWLIGYSSLEWDDVSTDT